MKSNKYQYLKKNSHRKPTLAGFLAAIGSGSIKWAVIGKLLITCELQIDHNSKSLQIGCEKASKPPRAISQTQPST